LTRHADTARLWRLPPDLWRVLLDDRPTQIRYYARVCRLGTGQCWYWTGALSSTGHGRLRAGTRRGASAGPGSRVVASHVYGYQLSRGVLRPGADGQLPVIRHQRDEASCHNPAHWGGGTALDNSRDYAARRRRTDSPLADRRGPGGRAAAIRDAILAARGQVADIGEAIRCAAGAGLPAVQGSLF